MTKRLASGQARENGSRLRTWREQERLTLAEVSALTGYSEPMLSLVETGKRRLSRQGKVLLARRLGVPLRELFEVEAVPEEEVAAS